MKKILLVATTLVAGLTVGLTQAEEADAGKGGKGAGKGGQGGKGGDPAARVEHMLKTLDTDKSGTISKAEFEAGPMAAKIKESRGEDAIDKIFDMRDKNEDGELDKKELSAPPKGGKGGSGKGGKKSGEE